MLANLNAEQLPALTFGAGVLIGVILGLVLVVLATEMAGHVGAKRKGKATANPKSKTDAPPVLELALLLLPLLLLLLAGCSTLDGGGGVDEDWHAGGCTTASTETDQVMVCGVGLDQHYDWDDPPTFTCRAEWKHLGKVEFTNRHACGPGNERLDEVMPTFAGRLEWIIDNQWGSIAVLCSLKLTRFDNTTLAIDAKCARGD
jgi:hypothetical protein